MLTVSGVHKSYGQTIALQDITFSLDKGELVGLIGQNGAGKTTLLHILAGRLVPDSGQVSANGYDVLWEAEAIRNGIGYMPERPALYEEMTVIDHLRFICHLKQIDRRDIDRHIKDLAVLTGVQDVLGRRIANLSRGYRQRVSLSMALVGDPEYILLDEPTNGFDPVQISEFRKLAKRLAERSLVLLSTHILRDLDGLCTRSLILNEGHLIKDLNIRDNDQQQRVLRVELALGQEAAEKLLNSLQPVSVVDMLKPPSPGISAALITSRRDAPVEYQLFRCLSKHDVPLLYLAPVKSELEEVFLSAIGHDQRDRGNYGSDMET